MGVRFVLGRAGTGKTRYCFDAIVGAMRARPLGPAIYWLLPRQATFDAERQLTCGSDLDAFGRARVLSIASFASEILIECGGSAAAEIDDTARRMLISHVIRQHKDHLAYFGGSAGRPGLAAEIESALDEIDRAGLTAEELTELAQTTRDTAVAVGDDAGATLGAKLHDLALVARAYESAIGNERLDPHRRLRQVLQCMADSPTLRDAEVYIDGFLDYTQFERVLLAQAARVCRSMTVTALVDPASPVADNPDAPPDELSPLHKTQRSFARLHSAFRSAGVAILPHVRLNTPARYRSPQLRRLEQAIAVDDVSGRVGGSEPAVEQIGSDHAVELIEAHDQRAEVHAAARRITALLREGVRMRDIAVLARSLDTYEPLIESIFAEHGLCWFVDRRKAAAHYPLLRLVHALMSAAMGRWPTDAMIAIARTELAGIGIETVDKLENYVLAYGVRGDVWASTEDWALLHATTTGHDNPEATDIDPLSFFDDPAPPPPNEIDAARRALVALVQPLRTALQSPTLTAQDAAAALWKVIGSLDIPTTLNGWAEAQRAAGHIGQADKHVRVWQAMCDLLDQIVNVLGPIELTPDDFAATLEAGMDAIDLGLTPPTVDQILVGQVDRTRSSRVTAAIVLGLSEGMFPSARQDTRLLSDRDRTLLARREIAIEPDTRRLLLDETLLGYIAFTRASDRLIVTRPTADAKGRPLAASSLWNRLLAALPEVAGRVTTLSAQSLRTDPTCLSTPRLLMSAAARWASDPKSGLTGGPGDEIWPALYQRIAAMPSDDSPMDFMRRAAWAALAYHNTSRIEPATAASLFASPLRTSARQIEQFAACPFAHFVRFGLQLKQREEAGLAFFDIDRLLHRVLDSFVRELMRRTTDYTAVESPQTESLIRMKVAEAAVSLRKGLRRDDPRVEHMIRRVESTLRLCVRSMQAIFSRGTMRPLLAGVRFGERSHIPPLHIQTPGGRDVYLTGRIDRIDADPQKARLSVIDYRAWEGRLHLHEAYHGLSLELLLTLLVLREAASELTGTSSRVAKGASAAPAPAAALYLGLIRQIKSLDTPDDAPEAGTPEAAIYNKMRGLTATEALGLIDRALEPGSKSPVVCVSLRKDGEPDARSECLADKHLAAMLDHTRVTVARLADQLFDGDVSVQPYRLGSQSPCSKCSYRSICRFRPGVDGYRHLDRLGRDDILARLTVINEPAAAGKGAHR